MTGRLLTRSAVLERSRANLEARTIPASLSSEEPVMRYGRPEVLSHDPAAIDLTRAEGGLPLLMFHDHGAPIGVVENVRIEGRRLVGDLRFGQSARASEVWQDVLDGVLTRTSIGYAVDASEDLPTGGVRATKWTLFEASVLAVPADPSVGINRGAQPHSSVSGDHPMPQVIIREQEHAEARALAQSIGLDAQSTEAILQRGLPMAETCRAMLDQLAQRDLESGGLRNLNVHIRQAPPSGSGAPLQRNLIVEALAGRLQGVAVPAENPYRHARCLDIARDCLEVRGIRTTSLSAAEIMERALHSTGDFPDLLQATGNRVLRQAYGAPRGVKLAFKSSTAADFRAKQKLALGEAPTLLKVNEHGEFKSGSMDDTKASYALATFGRIFGVTRQALINDDLDAFGDMATRLGRAAAEFEAQFLVDLLTSNPTMTEDNLAVFHASHGNLATGGSAALSFDALNAARKAMRLQKGIDKKTPVDAAPAFLMVPAALETQAEQLLAEVQATKVADVNPFSQKMQLIVDPRFDAVSSTRWYLAASASQVDTVEYSYLEGAGGPEVFIKEGFEVDGTQFKVRLDFGAGVLDFRGLYRADGA